MKKKILTVFLIGNVLGSSAQIDSLQQLQEVTVISLHRNQVTTGSLLDKEVIEEQNHGQEPSSILAKLPGIYAYGDNGTQFGYSYFRMRGLGQERINYTIDDIPIIQESEDFGCYFSNIPDFISSMGSIKVEKGASLKSPGSAAYAGSINFSSIDPSLKKEGIIDLGYGNFGTSRISGIYNTGDINGFSAHIRGTKFNTEGFKNGAYNRSTASAVKLMYRFNSLHSIDFLSLTGYHENQQAFYGLSELPKHLNPFGHIQNANSPQETDNFFLTINKFRYQGWLNKNTYLTSSLYWTHMKGDYRLLVPNLWNYDLNHHLGGINLSMRNWIGKFTYTTTINAQRFERTHTGTELPSDTVITKYTGSSYPDLYKNKGTKDEFLVSEQIKFEHKNLSIIASLQYRTTSLSYKTLFGMDKYDKDFKYSWDLFNTGLDLYYRIKNNTLYTRWSSVGKEPSRVDILGGEYRMEDFAILDPSIHERVQDIEVGWEYKSTNLRANVNLYYMHFQNELVANGELSKQNGLPLHVPLGGNRYGIEGSMIWSFGKYWKLTENISLSRNNLTDYKTHPFSPSITSFSEIDFRKGKWNIGLNSNIRSNMYADLENKFSLGSGFMLGGYMGYKITSAIEGRLDLINITNRLNTSNGYVDEGTLYYLIDTPFSFFAGIKIKL